MIVAASFHLAWERRPQITYVGLHKEGGGGCDAYLLSVCGGVIVPFLRRTMCCCCVPVPSGAPKVCMFPPRINGMFGALPKFSWSLLHLFSSHTFVGSCHLLYCY